MNQKIREIDLCNSDYVPLCLYIVPVCPLLPFLFEPIQFWVPFPFPLPNARHAIICFQKTLNLNLNYWPFWNWRQKIFYSPMKIQKTILSLFQFTTKVIKTFLNLTKASGEFVFIFCRIHSSFLQRLLNFVFKYPTVTATWSRFNFGNSLLPKPHFVVTFGYNRNKQI